MIYYYIITSFIFGWGFGICCCYLVVRRRLR